MSRRRGLTLVIASAALGLVSGCTLQEVVVADPEDIVVAEVYVELGGRGFGSDRVVGFIHRTVNGPGPDAQLVPGARVTVTRPGGEVIEVPEVPADSLERCVSSTPVGRSGSCYLVAGVAASDLEAGERLTLRVELPGGGLLESAATVPGEFTVAGVGDGGACLQPASTPLTIRWSSAEGAWAYVGETLIHGLDDVLAPLGLVVEDPLYLLGLSVSAADTAIVFPGEFGVFNRFELDRGVATILQQGLPAGTSGTVMIAAVDRNYVNWVRGGNFNPSGQVRVPSVRGDGTGVFGASVVRELQVAVDPFPDGGSYGFPPCPE